MLLENKRKNKILITQVCISFTIEAVKIPYRFKENINYIKKRIEEGIWFAYSFFFMIWYEQPINKSLVSAEHFWRRRVVQMARQSRGAIQE